jgi:hydroxymethylglutaryl-CoA reductase
MKFISTNLEVLLPLFEKLEADQMPLWGTMKAQRMIEHLSETLEIAAGEKIVPMEVPEEKIEKMLAFLESDKPMARNLQVTFAAENTPLKHDELELAIDEYVERWIDLEALYAVSPSLTNPHPYYGELNFEQWKRLHAKHLTHHFEQFGLI